MCVGALPTSRSEVCGGEEDLNEMWSLFDLEGIDFPEVDDDATAVASQPLCSSSTVTVSGGEPEEGLLDAGSACDGAGHASNLFLLGEVISGGAWKG